VTDISLKGGLIVVGTNFDYESNFHRISNGGAGL
jgi:hypothetical protein